MKELKLLLALAKRGALSRGVAVTSTGLGKELGIPQQSVSRLLIRLQERKLVSREKGIRGYVIRITRSGEDLLRNLGNDLREALSRDNEFAVKGRVVDGLRDGRYYMSLPEYKREIMKKLEFNPYPGTLNARLESPEDREVKERLQSMEGIMINGFRKGGRVFGSAKCFRARLNGMEGAVIIPARSHYGPETLEFISQHNLRSKLKLKNGSEVTIRGEFGK